MSKRERLLTILRTIPPNATQPHPEAARGTRYAYVRAANKSIGASYFHYVIKDTLYYVEA